MALSKLSHCELDRLSDVISTQLKLNGKTIREAKIIYSYVTLDENLLSSYGGLKTYYTGSFGEATFLQDSDQDIMIVAPNFRVNLEGDESFATEDITVVSAVVDKTLPCYAKLKVIYLDEKDQGIRMILEKGTDRELYISSDKFVEYFLLSARKKMKNRNGLHWFRNGPCASFVRLAADSGNPKEVDTDVAYAVRCNSWPKEAVERLCAMSKFDWPTKDVIEHVQLFPCHYVAVGRPNSEQSALEWRMSFVLVERELLRNLSEKQYSCLILLKMLTKSVLQDKHLSSYHVKTLLFWHSEGTSTEWWENTNLISCVVCLLTKLKTCIESRVLPHYILQKNNLFFYKFENLEDKDKIIHKIEYLIQDISPILQHKSMGALCDLWTQYNIIIFLEVAESSWTSLAIKENVESEQKNIITLHCIMLFSRLMRLPLLNDMFMNFTQVLEYSRLDRAFNECLRKYLSVFKGLKEHSLALSAGTDDEIKKHHMHLAKTAFEKGVDADALSSQMYLATFLFMSGQVVAAKDRLIIALSRNLGILYCGSCSLHGFLKTEPMLSVSIMKREPMGHIPPHRRKSTGDVVFSSEYISCVPRAVQFECACSNTAISIHPLIYAYYLFVLVYHAMGDIQQRTEALDDLEKSLPVTNGGEERYRSRALNLMGSCYQLIGDFNKTSQVFENSAAEYPHATNAAIYHLLTTCSPRVLYSRK